MADDAQDDGSGIRMVAACVVTALAAFALGGAGGVLLGAHDERTRMRRVLGRFPTAFQGGPATPHEAAWFRAMARAHDVGQMEVVHAVGRAVVSPTEAVRDAARLQLVTLGADVEAFGREVARPAQEQAVQLARQLQAHGARWEQHLAPPLPRRAYGGR